MTWTGRWPDPDDPLPDYRAAMNERETAAWLRTALKEEEDTVSTDLTIEVAGRLDPVTLPAEDALRRLWRQVVELDLCEQQHEAMRRQLCGEVPEVLATLAVEGVADWSLVLRDRAQLVMRVSLPDGRSPRQRVGDRFVPVRLPGTRRCPGLWAIRDTATGDLVRQENEAGEPESLRFAIKESAAAWVARQANLAAYPQTRGLAAGGAL